MHRPAKYVPNPKLRRIKTNFSYDTPSGFSHPTSINVVRSMRDSTIPLETCQNIVYENVKPVFIILRFMGVFPLTKLEHGLNEFQFFSQVMCYAVMLFLTLIMNAMNTILHFETTGGKFEEVVTDYLSTVYLIPLCIMPIMWFEAKKIANVLNNWVNFERAYVELTGRVLSVNLYHKARAIAVIVPIVSTTSVIISQITMLHINFIDIIPYVVLEILTNILGGYWYLLCETLSVCSHIIAEDFKQALQRANPAGIVGGYRALWLQLSKLARNTGYANSFTISYVLLIITLSTYGLLSQISYGFNTKYIGLAHTACNSILLLFFICDKAHKASENIRSQIQRKLLMSELLRVNPNAEAEVKIFLRAMELKTTNIICLGGFLDVNRNLFKSLLSTIVTYLVILLQCKFSLTEQNIHGATNGSFNATSKLESSTPVTLTTRLAYYIIKKKRN